MASPTTLSWDGLWRASFSGSPWAGTASLGGSSGFSMSEATNPPTAGTAVNGFTPAAFNGTTQTLSNATTLASFATTTGWSMYAVLNPAAAGFSSIFSDTASLLEMRLGQTSASDISVVQWNGATQDVCATADITTGAWSVICAYYDGTNLNIRWNNNAWVQTASTGLSSTTGTPCVLSLTGGTAEYNGSMLEFGISKTTFSRTQFDYNVGLAVQERYALSLGFKPPVAAVYFDMAFRNVVERSRMRPSHMMFTSNPVAPPTAVVVATLPKKPVHPDLFERHIAQRHMHASRQMFTIPKETLVLGATATILTQNKSRQYPDRVVRPSMSADQQISAVLAPPQIASLPIVQNAYDHSVLPDMVPRPWYAAANQLAAARPPFQFTVAQIFANGLAEYPDAIDRVQMRAERIPYTTKIYPVPERTAVMTDVEFPERVPRPMMRADQQVAFTVGNPALGFTVNSAPDAMFPDAIDRQLAWPWRMPFTTKLSPVPERTAVMTDVEFPERVVRPWFSAGSQPAFVVGTPPLGFTIDSAPDATFPDTVTRPVLPVAEQLAVAWSPIQFAAAALTPVALTSYPDQVCRLPGVCIVGAPRQSPSFALPTLPYAVGAAFQPPIYPSRVERPAVLPSSQLATTSLAPFPLPPLAVTPVALTSYPDAVTRPYFTAAQQMVTSGTFPAGPGTGTYLAFQPPVFPAAVLRPFLSVADQLATLSIPPFPERQAPAASAVYPDYVLRPVFRAEQQMVTSGTLPLGAGASSALLFQPPVFPPVVLRPFFRADQQLAVTGLSPFQFVDPVPTYTFDHSLSPDFATRPFFRADQQLAVTEYSPYQFPAIVTPTDLQWYPDSVLRPIFRAEQQMVTSGTFPAGPGLGAYLLFQPPTFPARVDRPAMRAEQQMFTSEIPAFPLSLSITPYALTRFQDSVYRPAFLTSDQMVTSGTFPAGPGTGTYLAFQPSVFPDGVSRPMLRVAPWSVTSPQPIVASPSPGGLTEFPDFATRAMMPASAQLATTIGTAPERTAALSDVEYPDRVIRPWMPTAAQLATARSMAPERTTPLADAEYPDRIPRPSMPTSEQLVTTSVPYQERTSPLATAIFPDAVRRGTPVAQSFMVTGPKPERTTPPADVEYPDRIPRPSMLAAEHPAFVIPLILVVSSATAYARFPDFVRRPFVLPAQQPFFAFGSFLTPSSIRYPACLEGSLALSAILGGGIAVVSLADGAINIVTRTDATASLTTTETPALSLTTSDNGTLEGCEE